MKKLVISIREKKLLISYNDKSEIIFDEKEYKNIIEDGTLKFFKYTEHINQQDLENNFLGLFNLILLNNISNYIIQIYKKTKTDKIVLKKSIINNSKKIINRLNKMDSLDVLGNIVSILINSEEYLNEKIKIDYDDGTLIENNNIINNGLKYFFNFVPEEIVELKNKLEIDLVAFEFLKDSKKNENGRYSLPIYVDYETMINKGLENYSEYIVNWMSISYLNMITKIHDYFVDYYKLEYSKGLVNDNLMICLIDLLDFEEKPYPKGLKKSIEVGRSTAGKCYFIEGIVKPISISQYLALILQAKDAFNVVPKLLGSNF